MDLLFVLKKLLSLFLGPVAIVLELLFFGILLYALSRRSPRGRCGIRNPRRRRLARRTGLILVFLGAGLLYLGSIAPVSGALTLSLESKAAVSLDGSGEVATETEPEFIVVLAGGSRAVPGKPVLSRLTRHGMARVVGGVDLWKRFPDASFVVTGHPYETGPMSRIAQRLGVPAENIIKETQSRDTKDHPRYLKEILGEAPFLLVTSATHMPRAAGLFRKQELDPVLAPVDFMVWPGMGDYEPYAPDALVPKASNLFQTATALHEMMGLCWAALRGQLDG